MKVSRQCLGFFLQPLDRDEPTGRPQWRFTVFAQDDGGNGLVGYADVQVNLKDINDNAPLFPQGVYYGNVTENGTAGESLAAQSCKSFKAMMRGDIPVTPFATISAGMSGLFS